jgi:hypothetical protein
MIDRQEIFEVIEDERIYQDNKWKKPQHSHSVTEYLVFISHYVNDAMKKVSTMDGEKEALPNIRKIAALAVAAMEENGVSKR